jgi:outer membrane receptor for ferrienterochelin and colicins
LGDLDPRNHSPTWEHSKYTITFNKFKIWALCRCENILNWTPNKGNPFIIARANDPTKMCTWYQRNVQATPDNPYALTFDPSYVYGPNQAFWSFWFKIYVEVVFLNI